MVKMLKIFKENVVLMLANCENTHIKKDPIDTRHKKTDLKVFVVNTDFLEFESFDFIDHIL